MNKHTPGLWIAVKNTSGSDSKKEPYLILQDKPINALNIATVIPCIGMDDAEIKANAILIANAPQMLSRLEKIVKILEILKQSESDLSDGVRFYLGSIKDLAESAIKQSTI